MSDFGFAAFAVGVRVFFLLSIICTSALADDAACIEKFKILVVDGNQNSEPVRIHVFQDAAGLKSENYFFSPGDNSGDGLMQPLENMGQMWVLFRNKKMYMSTDEGTTWAFVRDMDNASQPEAYKEQVRNDLSTADKVKCGQEAVDGVMHDSVEGEYKSSALQGAMSSAKYWVRQDTGFISKFETSSDGAGGKFYSLQIIEKAPDLELPLVE